eukprot:TRINITY_DN5371_c0_g1_i1.p1 TRINITY_DN5371_c0_g1~~TRINITY_DN5371_c0_g1_i1.p1  ORF type:complete len:225 (-),score=35.77 TRINITY_DN5371_c0_g1_i1:312-986(-)
MCIIDRYQLRVRESCPIEMGNCCSDPDAISKKPPPTAVGTTHAASVTGPPPLPPLAEDWGYMAVTQVKDLGGQGGVFRIEVHCAGDTTMDALKARVEARLGASFDFSVHPAKLSAMVPLKADAWTDACEGEQTMGEIEEKYGYREDDCQPPRDASWRKSGVLMPGVHFYATTGEPTAEGGFAIWEQDEVEHVLVVTIADNGDTVCATPRSRDGTLSRTESGAFR